MDVHANDTFINFYAGAPPLNRLSFVRSKADVLNAHLSRAKFLVFNEGKPLVHKGKISSPYLVDLPAVQALVGDGFLSPPEGAANAKAEEARRAGCILVFLGVDERGCPPGEDLLKPHGTPYFAIDATPAGVGLYAVPGDAEDAARQGTFSAPPDSEWADARMSASLMDAWHAGLFASGRPIVDWNARNRYCPACGRQTYSLWGGWKRSCVTARGGPEERKKCFSNTGLHNFAHPRTDPVIIMGILDETGDRMLLGRNKSWPKGMYSCLAGFIEPGESFEEAVRREVLEEAGIVVGPVRYGSSQPWPYPANLMVGCYGRAPGGQTIRLDLDNELEDAQFFPRSVVARVASSKFGSKFTKDDYNQLDKAQEDRDINAPAMIDPRPMDKFDNFTKCPPATAIAGVLMRQWALGTHATHLVSSL
ncbi:hypothetical protein CC85DRAFT_303475 [Cutaneotrichosporon oleaginosum]|uniref:NAD(+) diphosphatase n=1 Tax=Cutaneotrichosporon oleaginosum TaxID=879819 RepID=A0A0J0XJD5_9TREE|nr:uncharacterized protein CC85DRAFT_303475 [Cutaneotrichosporon oleaginosum]KLT41166.1 hypothetical protein CC85DRAFT_303475 [Cutaneotrichosporon oleaginosum]TXT14116.1 hypothetical protein COLE_00309 [Cutaneotrichosporon oleaginosum]